MNTKDYYRRYQCNRFFYLRKSKFVLGSLFNVDFIYIYYLWGNKIEFDFIIHRIRKFCVVIYLENSFKMKMLGK